MTEEEQKWRSCVIADFKVIQMKVDKLAVISIMSIGLALVSLFLFIAAVIK